MKKSQIFTLLISSALLASCGNSTSMGTTTTSSDTSDTSTTTTHDPIDINDLEEEGYLNTWLEVQEAINSWCVAKELSTIALPAPIEDGEQAFAYVYFVNGSSEFYYDQFGVNVAGNVESEYVAKLASAGWNVPAEPGEYGYECIDDETNPTFELDVQYSLEEDLTIITLYSYDDLYGDEGDNGVVDTWSEVQSIVNDWSDELGLSHVTLPALSSDGAEKFVVMADSIYGYVMIFVEEDVLGAYLQKLENAGWVVPTVEGDYGFQCYDDATDPTYELDVTGYSDDEGSETALFLIPYEESGTDISDYGYIDTWSECMDLFDYWCEAKELETINIPVLGEDGDSAFYYEYYLLRTDGYADYIYLSVEGNCVTEYLAKLESNGFDIPDEAGDFGYECFDESLTFEIDVDYDSEYLETCITIYSFYDLFGY